MVECGVVRQGRSVKARQERRREVVFAERWNCSRKIEETSGRDDSEPLCGRIRDDDFLDRCAFDDFLRFRIPLFALPKHIYEFSSSTACCCILTRSKGFGGRVEEAHLRGIGL